MTLLFEVGTFVGESTRVGGETRQSEATKSSQIVFFSSALISSLLLPGIGTRRPLPSLIYLAYQVGAKYEVAYQEGLWPVARTWPTGKEQSSGWPTTRRHKDASKAFGLYLP